MFSKIFSAIVRIITITVILFVIAFLGLKFTGHTPFIVLSSSMEPTIQTGSIAFINTHDKDNLQVGDIITYVLKQDSKVGTGNNNSVNASAGKTVTHRIVGINGNELVMKGDANDTADFVTIKKSQVIGRYMFQVPKIGYLLSADKRILWFVLIGVLVLLNIAASFLIKHEEDKELERAAETKNNTTKLNNEIKDKLKNESIKNSEGQLEDKPEQITDEITEEISLIDDKEIDDIDDQLEIKEITV